MPRTILLADDSVTIRKIVELTFGETDIRVESVPTGTEALERFPDLKPDLVLADVVMPGRSGYEVCRAVKDSERPVPVLLLAGTFEPFDAEMAAACGSDGHITKPFDSRALIERVERLLTVQAEPPAAVGVVAGVEQDAELEAMFDDLAAPAGAVREDRPEAPAHAEADTPPVRPGDVSLSAAEIDAIARVVIERLSERIVREIAWDVVPDLAEILVRERIRELERDKSS